MKGESGAETRSGEAFIREGSGGLFALGETVELTRSPAGPGPQGQLAFIRCLFQMGFAPAGLSVCQGSSEPGTGEL